MNGQEELNAIFVVDFYAFLQEQDYSRTEIYFATG
jgi:hypothetical protein